MKKLNKTYIQEAFWLIFVVIVAWALIATRPANTEIGDGYQTGKISSLQKYASGP